jgi:hypothetical protein
MTPEVWSSFNYPDGALSYLVSSGKASERKLRLYAVACVRQLHALLHEAQFGVLAALERFADGEAGRGEQRAAEAAAEATMVPDFSAAGRASTAVRFAAFDSLSSTYGRESMAAVAARYAAEGESLHAISPVTELRHEPRWPAVLAVAKKEQSELLRDFFGPEPAAPFPALPAEARDWQDGLVLSLAEAAYEDRSLPSGHLDPARLCVLSDALEEAGGVDSTLVSHLREKKTRYRGFWALDVVLERW